MIDGAAWRRLARARRRRLDKARRQPRFMSDGAWAREVASDWRRAWRLSALLLVRERDGA